MNSIKVNSKDGNIHIGEQEFRLLIQQLLRQYRFFNDNKQPGYIAFPMVEEVEGVPIVFEEVEKKEVDTNVEEITTIVPQVPTTSDVISANEEVTADAISG